MEKLSSADSIDIIALQEIEMERAFRCLEAYASADGVNERQDIIEHAQRTTMLVRAYAGKLIPPEAVGAVLLHDVVDRLINANGPKHTPPRSSAAKEALAEFFTNPDLTEEQGNYYARILADMVRTEQASGQHRVKMAHAADEGRIPLEIVQMMSEQYQGDIPSAAWAQTEPLLDFDHMRRFLKDVNVESVIIKACELLDNMYHPSSLRQSAWLQDILEAESFYAPIVEVLGLDGLASQLRSTAHIIRLRNQGEESVVAKAMSMRELISHVGIESIIRQAVGADDERCAIHPAVDEVDGEVVTQIGEFVVETSGRYTVAGNYRLKCDGNAARKLIDQQGEPSMDVVGMTVISDDVAQSAERFADFIERQLPKFVKKPSYGKDGALYIQGTDGFVETMLSELSRRSLDDGVMQKRDHQEDIGLRGHTIFEVAKVTFLMKRCVKGADIDIPVEIQFVTRHERERTRTGPVAHIIYKHLKQLTLTDKDISRRVCGYRQALRWTKTEQITVDNQVNALRARLYIEQRSIVESAAETFADMKDRKSHLTPYELTTNQRSAGYGDQLLETLAA